MKRLPPLNALRAFEAAARHKSFTAAARDLFVTHGAVSRQIQHIEEFLGCRLFKRLPRGVELTDEGREYAMVVRRAFEDVAEASSSPEPQLLRHLVERSVAIHAALVSDPRPHDPMQVSKTPPRRAGFCLNAESFPQLVKSLD